jgi:hypothetical protein
MAFRTERWRVQPVALPVVWRHCTRCAQLQAFICSERFRINAQKKLLDVWLIYRCQRCEERWKCAVLSRQSVTAIEPERLAAFECNDAAMVQRHACDLARLQQHVARIEVSEQVRIERQLEPQSVEMGDVVRFEVTWPCKVRLERLLAGELCNSRSLLQRLHADGRLLLYPADALRKPVRDGQRVCFVGGIDALPRSG